MKRRWVVLMLGMVLVLGMTACSGQEAAQGSTTVQENQIQQSSEQTTEINSDGKEEDLTQEEPVTQLFGNYIHVGTDYVDGIDYSQNELTFLGEDGVRKVKGYYIWNGILINGAGIVMEKYLPDSPKGVISICGEMLVPMGKYDSLDWATGHATTYPYILAKEADTQLYGIISPSGEEIVPFQYEEISVHEKETEKGSDSYFGFYVCKKGDNYDFLKVDGSILLEGGSTNNFLIDFLYEDKQGNWMFQLMVGGEKYNFIDGGSRCLSKPEDYASEWQHRGDRIFSYKDKNGEAKVVCYSDDWNSMEYLNSTSTGRYTRLGNKMLISVPYIGSWLVDEDGNILHNIPRNLGIVCDYGGKFGFFGFATIYNDKFEEVKEVPECKQLKNAGGFFYTQPLEGASGPYDLYDFDGNLVFKNITMVEFSEKFISFYTEDGTYAYKNIDMPEVVFAVEGETFRKLESGRFWFSNEAGQTILRDENMNEIVTFDEWVQYNSIANLFKGDGKYYNWQGEVVYEE